VSITRFVIKDSIEEKIIRMQQQKMALAADALSSNEDQASLSRLSLTELKFLFSN